MLQALLLSIIITLFDPIVNPMKTVGTILSSHNNLHPMPICPSVRSDGRSVYFRVFSLCKAITAECSYSEKTSQQKHAPPFPACACCGLLEICCDNPNGIKSREKGTGGSPVPFAFIGIEITR